MATFATLTVPGTRAPAELARLRAEAGAAGRYPVLLGSARDFALTHESMKGAFDPAAILAQAGRLSGDDLLAEWRAGQERDPDPEATPQPGDWLDADPGPGDGGIVSHRDPLSREPHPEVVIGLFPVAHPWQVFAHLNWGAFNGCPGAAEHCAVQRHWAGRHGAEVVAVTHDVVECVVARPPMDRAGALALAWEQYAYCPDLVDQGTGTVADLAAGLLGERVWCFWWD